MIEFALAQLERMMLIRAFEEAAAQALIDGYIRGPVHQYIGQEAVAVGVCSSLNRDDLLQSNHRGHGHALAKGASPEAMMLELFGRVGGTNGGKGGSMHIADFSVGMMGANGILADGVTLGVGAAHAVKLRGENRVVAAFVGDGTINRGPFYEGMNWAKVFNLPFLLVCEDNGYASSTMTGVVTSGHGPAARAEAFGLPSHEVDGNDIFAVSEMAAMLVQKIRNGEGPQFLVAKTYRVKGHISRDQLLYRPSGETERRFIEEPVGRAIHRLIQEGALHADIEDIRAKVDARIVSAVEAAKLAPTPALHTAFEDVQDLGAPQWPN
ncbi:MAG: thiamine pyrophosphate-dependent dehydrogenase E1 component subunit alpha [Novosphingobium sp.]